MIKKVIPYTDFDGNPRVEEFWFNLTKAEMMDLGLSKDGGYDKYMEQLMHSTKVGEAIEVFKKILLLAYGKKSLDGRKFEKSPEITADFVATQAYSDLYVELASDPDKAAEFMNGVMGADVRKMVAENEAKAKAAEVSAAVAAQRFRDQNFHSVTGHTQHDLSKLAVPGIVLQAGNAIRLQHIDQQHIVHIDARALGQQRRGYQLAVRIARPALEQIAGKRSAPLCFQLLRHGSSPMLLFVILRARVDRARAVDLLGEHDARQMVRERHRRHTQPQRRLALELLVQTERPADKKAHLRRAARSVTGQLPCERLAREELSLDAHGDHGRALRDARADGLCLFFQCRADLFR